MRSSSTMYYGQRDWRGRAQVYSDPGDGTGPYRLRFVDPSGKEQWLPDWGKHSDIGRRDLLALAILAHALDDEIWASQIGYEFAAQVIERLPALKWSLSASAVFAAVAAIEQGQEIVIRHG